MVKRATKKKSPEVPATETPVETPTVSLETLTETPEEPTSMLNRGAVDPPSPLMEQPTDETPTDT